MNEGHARELLTFNLVKAMKNRMQDRTKTVSVGAQKTLSKRGFNLFLQAPDYQLAAAVLIMSKFKINDREELYDVIIEKNELCPAFKDKLKLLNEDFYHGHRLFVNSYLPGQEAEHAENSRKIHFNVWLNLVRRMRVLTNAEFATLFPEAAYKADLWIETIDQNGQPRLNPKKHWEYVNKWKANKRQKKMERKAAEAKQKKF